MTTDERVQAETVLPIVEKWTQVAAADDLDKKLADMFIHKTTLAMKTVVKMQEKRILFKGTEAPPTMDSQRETTWCTLQVNEI